MLALSATQLKIAGLALLLLPVGFLLIFAIGETLGGDLSGLQHLVQAAPLVLLALLAWSLPTLGGVVLLVIGGLLALAYPLLIRGLPVGTLLLVEAILFAPAVLSGLLFVLAGRRGG